MREFRTSGSVGALGGQPPRATRLSLGALSWRLGGFGGFPLSQRELLAVSESDASLTAFSPVRDAEVRASRYRRGALTVVAWFVTIKKFLALARVVSGCASVGLDHLPMSLAASALVSAESEPSEALVQVIGLRK